MGLNPSKDEWITTNQERLYDHLQGAGFFWNSANKEWEEHDQRDADEPTGLIMIRVWADSDIVEDVADDVVSRTKNILTLVEKSKPYICRPPKQLEARVYLRFIPKEKK